MHDDAGTNVIWICREVDFSEVADGAREVCGFWRIWDCHVDGIDRAAVVGFWWRWWCRFGARTLRFPFFEIERDISSVDGL